MSWDANLLNIFSRQVTCTRSPSSTVHSMAGTNGRMRDSGLPHPLKTRFSAPPLPFHALTGIATVASPAAFTLSVHCVSPKRCSALRLKTWFDKSRDAPGLSDLIIGPQGSETRLATGHSTFPLFITVGSSQCTNRYPAYTLQTLANYYFVCTKYL